MCRGRPLYMRKVILLTRMLAKEKILGVSHNTLEKHGAVSAETAKEMAVGAANSKCRCCSQHNGNCSCPDRRNKYKPVGLIYIACSVLGKVYGKELRLKGTREENRAKTVEEALKLFLENF